jgi:hypothetical protein
MSRTMALCLVALLALVSPARSQDANSPGQGVGSNPGFTYRVEDEGEVSGRKAPVDTKSAQAKSTNGFVSTGLVLALVAVCCGGWAIIRRLKSRKSKFTPVKSSDKPAGFFSIPTRFKSYWPDIVDAASAANAVKTGYRTAFLVAALTALISIIAIIRGPFLGYDGYSLVDAAVAGIVGWRIMRFSRAWSIVGLCLWALSMGVELTSSRFVFSAVDVVRIIVLFAFINGVRGTFAHQRYGLTQLTVPAM